MYSNIQGDVLIIQGDFQPEVKIFWWSNLLGTLLTYNCYGIGMNITILLFATSGCIGSGLESPDVYSVCRVRLPSGILDMVQEMDQCG